MLLSLRMVQAIFATPTMDEVIPATVTCSLFIKLDFDSILVDVPVALTALRTLRLPHILRGLLVQRLPGTTLDTFDSCETPAGVAHISFFHAAVHAPLGDHHMSDKHALRLLALDPLDAALFLALQFARFVLTQDGTDFHLLLAEERVCGLGHFIPHLLFV
jgi:hypothetical protein